MVKTLIIAAIVVVIIFAIIGSASNTNTATETTQPTPIIAISTSPTPDSQLDNTQPAQVAIPQYEIKYQDENNRVENYELIIKTEADGEAAALDVKKRCKKPCNIFVYDDANAQQLEREYDEISDGDSATAWKQQNYVYVADHLVGSIDFEAGEWTAYPYRDFYYRQLGGKN